MRYLLSFLFGLAVGAASVFFLLRNQSRALPPPQSKVTIPTAPRPTPSEEQVLAARVGMTIQSAEVSIEKAISDEAQQKPLPKLEPPANMTAESLIIPVVGVQRGELRQMFDEQRGSRAHRAIDIAAPRGTAVVAAIDGPVAKLFLSKAGGITVYQYDPSKAWIYYYAHLDGYAPNLAEGQLLRRGDLIGFVGTSGNAPPDAPHLHFAIEKLTQPGQWWKSEPVDPYPLLSSRGITIRLAN